MSARVLTLYTGVGCHLCDQGRAVAEPVALANGWVLEKISITGDVALTAAYGIRIPVLRTPSGAELGWPFSPGQVRRLLAAEPG
ncbi:MAG: glutaredoxin family protein [Pseudomonadales bacterium]|nr:glutaredoxin family protein [Pseudomonadales bacterium]